MMEPEWDAVIEVHLKGTFAPSRHAAAYWRNRSKEIDGPVNARIINTSSVSGIYGNTGQTNYGAAKAGIAAFTVIAARELKRYGVTVNAVAPQALTRMTEGLRERTEEQKAAMHPGRVSHAVVWIASLESSDFTGRIVEAGGGLLGIAEGWHRGPTVTPEEDPTKLGPVMLELQARARKNAGMNGVDLD
jgi:NAD(P)-dependent dehydrogenase (short-subunit alcohol dehydrogenase family)